MSSSSSTAAPEKIIVLMSSDGEKFEVEQSVAVESEVIKHLIEDDYDNCTIPILNVDAKILSRVIEYCRRHVTAGKAEAAEDLEKFDAEFVKVNQRTMFDVIKAANYLAINSLRDLMCKTVAGMMKGKTVEEIRKTFNIKNDYTAEEEAEVRKESALALKSYLTMKRLLG